MSIDVSVVVPVYNSEAYLKECVDSIIHQTLKNIEIIFVDDGSTDRSAEILEEYRKKDDRITILHQKNLYAGVARNNGLKAATGKYVIFLDSDDFFELNMLEEAFRCAEENQTQITIFDYYRYNHQTGEITAPAFRQFPEGVFSAAQLGSGILGVYDAVPWNKLFLRAYILDNHLAFQAVRKCNDNFFVFIAGFAVDRMVYIKKHFVYYRINNTDSLQGNVENAKDSFIVPLKEIKQELKRRGLFNEEFKEAYDSYLKHVINYYANAGRDSLGSAEKYYTSIKRALVPDLFDSPAEFEDNTWIRGVFESEDFESFLYLRLQEEKRRSTRILAELKDAYQEMVSKQSKDYKIGHLVLALPRAVMKWFERER